MSTAKEPTTLESLLWMYEQTRKWVGAHDEVAIALLLLGVPTLLVAGVGLGGGVLMLISKMIMLISKMIPPGSECP